MNISGSIRNEIHTLVLAAGEHRKEVIPGRYFLLVSNSLITDVHVGIGDDGYRPWPVLFSCRTRKDDEFFDKVRFYNPAGAAMTVEYIISTEDIDNKSAEVTGTITIPIDDTTNGTETPASIVVQPRAGVLIDVDEVVDVGGGVVGIPITGHPFTAGDNVIVTGCPQYNGANTVVAGGGADQVNITATFKGGLIDNAAAVDVGGGVVGIPITGHPYATDETITIANTTNYDGDYLVLASSTANQVDITAAYIAETFDGVSDSHNLTFDGVDDKVGLAAAQSIPAGTSRKELHVTNHDTTYKVFWGDSNVNATTYRGVIIQPDSVYIITCTDEIFLACEDGAGVAGCIVSWANKTKS